MQGGRTEGQLTTSAPHALRIGEGMTNTVWKCEQWRAGKVYSKVMFATREEAEQFRSEISKAEPDLFWRIEPVEARMVWN
jgi:hypothetical protein